MRKENSFQSRLLSQLKSANIGPNQAPTNVADWKKFLGLVNSSYLETDSNLSERNLLYRELQDKTETLLQKDKMIAMGEMAGGIAHEINNPLTVISNLIEIIEHKAESQPLETSELLTDFEKIKTMVFRIAKIINGLKAISRDSKHDPFVAVKIQNVIAETTNLCKIRLKSNHIDFKINHVPDCSVLGNEAQICQVLLTLINNSFDAIARTHEPFIELNFKESQSRIELSITDSGPGISPEISAKIFNPFFTTKEIGKGVGLGLSVAKGIILKQRGNLYLDKTAKNTKFVIDLPKIDP